MAPKSCHDLIMKIVESYLMNCVKPYIYQEYGSFGIFNHKTDLIFFYKCFMLADVVDLMPRMTCHITSDVFMYSNVVQEVLPIVNQIGSF